MNKQKKGAQIVMYKIYYLESCIALLMRYFSCKYVNFRAIDVIKSNKMHHLKKTMDD